MPSPNRVQLNVGLTEAWTVRVNRLTEEQGWTRLQTMQHAVVALEHVLRRLSDAPDADGDLGDLFRRVLKVAPALLAFNDVEHGVLSDGRPALMINEWVIAED